jgi:hypothetical protein
MLPLMVGALLVAHRPLERRSILGDVGAMVAAIAVYLAIRMQTPAFLPATAPWFYRPITDLRLLLPQALEYLDRGATIMVVFSLAIAAACWTRPRLERREGIVASAGAVWFAGGYALTALLPVRSSLYAVFPSVGGALALGACVDAVRRTAPAFDRRAAVVAALLLVSIPVYRARNRRWTEPAQVSERTMAAVMADLPGLPARGTIVFEDESPPPANFDSAFGTLAGEAVRLFTSRPLDARIIDRRGGDTLMTTADVVARYRLVDDRVDRVR